MKAEICAVVNDVAAKDKLAPIVYQMAMSPGVKLQILTLDDFVNAANSGQYQDKRAFVIMKTPEDALQVLEKGVKLDWINLGMMTPPPGQKGVVVSPGCWVLPHQVETYEKLSSLGVKLTVRMVPESRDQDLMSLIRSKVK